MAKKKTALSKLNSKIAVSNSEHNIEKKITSNTNIEQTPPAKTEIPEKQNIKTNTIKENKTENTRKERKKSPLKKLLQQETNPTSSTEKDIKSNFSDTKKIEYKDKLPEVDYEQLEKEIDTSDLMKARKRRKADARAKVLHQTISVILILSCIYIVFLIYGALNTKYTYNKDGIVVAQGLTVSQIRNIKDFEKIANEYRQARAVYEDVLKLDYRLAAGVEDPLVIAPDYEKELDMIEKLTIQTQAVNVSPKYSQTHSMLLAWIQNDIAIYCQRMSQAISQNNETYASQALEYKTIVYNDFSTITGNLTTLGKTVEGVDLTDLLEWSPEKYIRDNVGGLDGGNP